MSRVHRFERLSLACVLLLAPACGDDWPDEVLCGEGTRLVNGECVGAGTDQPDPGEPLVCGDGTEEIDGKCVAGGLEPGHYLSPLVQLQSLHEVGSHTDEVRIREDSLLLNCSYTFNVIDATTPDGMERTHAEGLTHVIPGDERTPGCKHVAWDENLVFTTHLGNIRNPAFLSGWDITDPTAPVQLPVLQEMGISYEGVDVANHNIFVGLHENGLGIYNYDATAGFTRVGSLGGFTNAWGIAARGNHAFVADGARRLRDGGRDRSGQPGRARPRRHRRPGPRRGRRWQTSRTSPPDRPAWRWSISRTSRRPRSSGAP